MFNFFKTTFRFELIHSDTLEYQPIDSTETLINYVIGANNYLIKKEETGWVYIEKFKETKKGEELLYVLKIELPLYEDTDYFDELLHSFYTKKRIPFKEVILPESIKKIEASSSTPELPPELKKLADEGKKRIQEDIEDVDVSVDNQLKQAEQQELIDQLIYQMEMQKEEIDQLKQLNHTETTVDSFLTPNNQKSESQGYQTEKKVCPGLSLDNLYPLEKIIQRPPNDSEPVEGLINQIKKEISSRLSLFLEEETKKLNEEMKDIDTRHLIKEDVTQRLEKEQQQALIEVQTTFDNERQAQIVAEKKRHETELVNIENRYLKQKQLKEKEVLDAFTHKVMAEVTNEYTKQTEKLNSVLQDKKEELTLKQKKMNKGLQTNFDLLLASFNDKQHQMIHQIEQRQSKQVNTNFDEEKQVLLSEIAK